MLSVIRPSERHLSAFVSWAHSAHDWNEARSESWEKTVVEFTGSLRSHGVAADVDLFHVDDTDVDWTRFGPQRIADSDVTIIAVSSAWRERWQGRNAANVGAGAAQEADELKGRFQHHQGHFQSTVKIVILPGASEDDIPNDLRRLPRYHIRAFNLVGLEELLRALFRKPRYEPLPPGVPPDLPLVNMISDSSGGTRMSGTASGELEQPSNSAARESKIRADLTQAEGTLRGLPAPHSGEGPDPPWYRQAWQRRDKILGMLTALNVATDTFVAPASQPPAPDAPGRSPNTSSRLPGAGPNGPTAQPPRTVTGEEGAAEVKSVSELLLQVSELLAEVALREVADARSLQAKGMYREAHALLTEAVDRLRAGQPQEEGAPLFAQNVHDLVDALRRVADTQRKEKLAELDEVVGRAATAVVDAGNQILEELIKEVPSVVEPLSSQVKIRTVISRKQLEMIFRDLGEQAAEQLTMIFQQRFEERITPDVSAALRTISVLPHQFRTALDEHLPHAVPAAGQDTPAAWGTIMPTLQLEERLSVEGTRLVDLHETEHELLTCEFNEEFKRIAGKVAFNGIFGVLLSAALKLLWVLLRDDALSAISKERRVKVVKRRLVTALQDALKGDDVRSAVGVASGSIETELHRRSELVRQCLKEATSTIGSADFAQWFQQHLSAVHQVLDRAAVQLDHIAARL